jgi:hypothetical protein
MTLSRRPRRNWSHRAAPLPPCENRLREQRRFKGNVRILLQPPRVHRFLDCFRGGLARVDSRSARLRSFLESPLWSHPSRLAFPTRKFLTPSSSAAAGGLSAALVLGRCLRRVLVCDAGHPRNEPARIFNGFLSRDGSTPAEFLQICRDQLRRYETIEFRK